MMQGLYACLFLLSIASNINGDFRPPAVPLIVFSPHISGMYAKSNENGANFSLNTNMQTENILVNRPTISRVLEETRFLFLIW